MYSAPFYDALHRAAHELGLDDVAWSFSIHVHDESWLRRRRDAGELFIDEVERDHIDLVPAS